MPGHAVVLRSQFHSRHVLHAHDPGVGRLANHDVLELFGRSEAALGAHRIGELLSLGNWLAAHLSGRVHGVLRLKRRDDFRNGDLQLRQLVRLHPQAHGILARAKYLNDAHALHASQRVVQIDVGVVGEEICVVGALRRIEGHQHQRREHRFLHCNAVVGDVHRKLRRGLRFTALRQDQIRVGIRIHVEIDDHSHLAVGGGIERIHVVHVVDAAHLLFDGRGHGLFDGLGVGADIDGRDLNLRRRDGGELGDGQAGDDHRAHDYRQDGDDHRNNRPIDEKFRHGGHFAALSEPKRLRIHLHSLANLLDAFGHDALARLETLADEPLRYRRGRPL